MAETTLAAMQQAKAEIQRQAEQVKRLMLDNASWESTCDAKDTTIATLTTRLEVVERERDEAKVAIETIAGKLYVLLQDRPGNAEGGGMLYEHHDPDGEYIGTTYIDPQSYANEVLDKIADIHRDAKGGE